MDNLFEISNDVQVAIDLKKPIVALESTLISHGLPYPDNIKVAKESISAVEDNGSVAATIGIIKGKVKIGLSEDDINILAKDSLDGWKDPILSSFITSEGFLIFGCGPHSCIFFSTANLDLFAKRNFEKLHPIKSHNRINFIIIKSNML